MNAAWVEGLYFMIQKYVTIIFQLFICFSILCGLLLAKQQANFLGPTGDDFETKHMLDNISIPI